LGSSQIFSFNISGSGTDNEFLRATILEVSPPLKDEDESRLQAWWYAGF
jgi:hypothetical protein